MASASMAGDADVGPDDAVTILVALLEEKDARLRDTLAREAELQGVNDELASRLAASQAANERLRTRMEGSLEAYRGTLEAAKASLRSKVRFSSRRQALECGSVFDLGHVNRQLRVIAAARNFGVDSNVFSRECAFLLCCRMRRF
jgi:hypothetical protein